MPPPTNNTITGTPLPASMLEHIQNQVRSSDDVWEQRFRALIEQLPAMLYTAAPDDLGHIEYTSSTFARWLGYPEGDWTESASFFESRLHPDDRKRVLASDARAIATGKSFTIEYRLQARDGSWHWVRDSAVLLRDEDGYPIAWQGVTVDITDLKAAEAKQNEARRLYRSLIEQVPAVVFRESVSTPPTTLYISPQVEELLGYSPGEWMGARNAWDLVVHPDDKGRIQQRTGNLAFETTYHDEYRMVTKEGRTIWVREDRELIADEYGHPTCWQGLIIDITRQKQLEEQLVHQARHDPLTGLPNRTYFSEILTESLESCPCHDTCIALLFLDLDGFKIFNDSLGHHVGDDLLIEVGDRLRRSLRNIDVVARLGGDEFAILLTYPIDDQKAIKIAERVLRSIRRPYDISGNTIRCSGSIGIAFGRAGNASLSDLLRRADLAMYQAKASGKDRYAVSEAE